MNTQAYVRASFLALTAACSSGQKEPEEDPARAPAASTAPPEAAPQQAQSGAGAAQRRIGRPLATETPSGFAMVDRVDVAAVPNEAAHKYTISAPTALPLRAFDLGPKRGAYYDDGRATSTSEAFEVQVVPNQDHVLIKAYDPAAKGQKVRVFIDDVPAEDWVFPDAAQGPYAEATYPLKGALIGPRSKLSLRFETAPGSPAVNSYYYWVFGKPDRKLDKPTLTNLSGLVATDRLDVGTEADEKTHAYAIDQPTYTATREFRWPKDGLPFLENVRATKSFESFRMRVTPGADHVLVKGFDAISKDQVARVFVDGKLVGNWSQPSKSARYAESSFRIPASFVGAANSVQIRLEFVSASADLNSFHYWLYSAPTKQAQPQSAAPTRASL